MEWFCPIPMCRAGATVENCPNWKRKQGRHKFFAQPTETDGIKFPSKKEARHYNELKLLQRAGEVLFFLRQVPFHLPGGIRYVVDFVVFKTTGEVEFQDVKGVVTKEYKTKKALVESLYPVEIVEV